MREVEEAYKKLFLLKICKKEAKSLEVIKKMPGSSQNSVD